MRSDKLDRAQTPRHSKLEKADILEMTVCHLQALHRQRRTGKATSQLSLFPVFFTSLMLVGTRECFHDDLSLGCNNARAGYQPTREESVLRRMNGSNNSSKMYVLNF